MLYWVISAIYVLVCAFLILVVLLQQGRGGMGNAFGGSSQTVFGGAGAGNVLTRATTASATLFMVLSAVLAYMSSSSDAALEERARQHEIEQENQRELREAAEASEQTDTTATDMAAEGEGGLVPPQPLQLDLGAGQGTTIDLGGLTLGQEPAGGEAAPAGGEAAPAGGEAAPAGGEAAPAGGEAAPA
ncbi:MAG: preprotein translocase subunit SecG, partial [Sandaracinaceae bacterium]|nr:preprotein translocase subunit SecG [Sandaracinaceae bacterium]